MDRFASPKILALCLILVAAGFPVFAGETLFEQALVTEGIPAGGPFVPAGSLYDNEQSNGTTSLASQDSTGTFTARSADDFILDGTGCASGVFDITQIRFQMVQQNAGAQAFAIDLFDDDGTGNFPTAGINPFANFAETSQVNLGAFGGTTSIFEVVADTAGLSLNADTKYWISGIGANAALNAAGFNNFFAVSNGSGATPDNGVIIAPDAGVAVWTATDAVVAPPRHAYAFAIDGACQIGGGPMLPDSNFDIDVPTMSNVGIGILAGVLALLALVVLVRRR